MFLSFRVFTAFLIGCCLVATAAAATVTVEVTPTFSPPAGIVDGYRAYKDCATTAALIGPAQSGSIFSFQHDTANGDPSVVVRAYNAAGEGTGNCTTLAISISPPGDTSTTYVCQLNPASGGTCVPQ